jgi:hypothetical protein
VRRFGPGERLVFEPYTKTIYEQTQAWIRERGFFDDAHSVTGPYEEAVALAGAR